MRRKEKTIAMKIVLINDETDEVFEEVDIEIPEVIYEWMKKEAKKTGVTFEEFFHDYMFDAIEAYYEETLKEKETNG